MSREPKLMNYAQNVAIDLLAPNPPSSAGPAAMLKMSDDEYNAHPAIRNSLLKAMARSPAHYLDALNNPKPPTPAMRLGSDAHAAILEPERFRSEFVRSPKFDKRTKEGKAAAEEFAAANEGKRLVDPESYALIEGAVKAVFGHPAASKELQGGRAEYAFLWQDSDTGAACKAKPDFIRQTNGVLVDVKTTIDASPAAFKRASCNFLYHTQAAFYLDGVNDVLGSRFKSFRLVVVENQPPHGVAVYEFDANSIEKGRVIYKRALEMLQECIARDIWPSYSHDVQALTLPAWAWSDS